MVRIGSSAVDAPGYDLTGLLVGSEGTLALVTEITVKLTRVPESSKLCSPFSNTVDDSMETVADITARGITPAACEMLDGWTLRAVEDYVHAGFPLDCAAVLLLEVDGLREAAENKRQTLPTFAARTTLAKSASRKMRANATALERPQERFRRGWPAFLDLLRAGRRDSPHEIAGHVAPDRRHRQKVRISNRQHFSCRRR